VRRRFVPLKQSQYVLPISSSLSNRSVSTMAARVAFTLTFSEASLRSVLSASSRRPLRTSHHGDSGVQYMPGMITRHQNHCSAKGME
jgi:hypothetical protein